MSARGAAGHTHEFRVAAVFADVRANPCECALHVDDVVRERALRRQAIVDRDAHPTVFGRHVGHQRLTLVALVADDPRTAVNLQQHGTFVAGLRHRSGGSRRADCGRLCRRAAIRRTRCSFSRSTLLFVKSNARGNPCSEEMSSRALSPSGTSACFTSLPPRTPRRCARKSRATLTMESSSAASPVPLSSAPAAMNTTAIST